MLALALLFAPAPGLTDTPLSGPPVPVAFDPALLGSVIGTALNFLRPRTLEAYSVRQFTLWGLNGLTAIDPALTPESTETSLRLVTPNGVLYAQRPPAETDLAGWTQAAVGMAGAAWLNSQPLRAAGQQALVQSFFDELFNHLDPYSRYIAPAPAATDRNARNGVQASAGLTVVREGRGIAIASVNANGPAWSAGISPGMRLLSVDGQPVRGMDEAAVTTLLNGDPGSSVSLTLGASPRSARRRHAPEQAAERTIVLTRAAVPPETVFAFSSGDIVVLRVTGFSADTAQEMSLFLDQAMQPDALGEDPASGAGPVKGLVFDLRGNRGGVLQQAVTSVALVLDHGVAVVTRGRIPQATHIWSVQGGDLTGGLPIVVMVDGRTASAAEIMAAALADHRRAVVIGSTTLGKGLVQTIAQLPDGGELFVTWSRVLAPLGWPLQGLGVMPEVCTSLGRAALDQAMQDLSSGVLDLREAVRQSRLARPPLPVARILEIRSACPAAIGTDIDLDTARALIDDPVRYHAALVPEDLGGAPGPGSVHVSAD
ncbi:PDZ domain-containing protein [Lichenicoccus roseus]|uniref:PDZ domain-containing protein n=2 Tax=Lichenicoccus roseus TaxID=2683649 RepID=A0A5R9JJV0_9PROT|nr:PDZ domain-containing protein [Lichenicoccus roseus]